MSIKNNFSKFFNLIFFKIIRNFPDLILAAMNIICNLYTKLSKTSPISFQIPGHMGSPLMGSNEGGKRSVSFFVFLNKIKLLFFILTSTDHEYAKRSCKSFNQICWLHTVSSTW